MTNRRLFLTYAASLAAMPYLGRGETTQAAPKFQNNPFSLGVASGDPDHESVVLWTRLAPEPLVDGGGMPAHAVDVRWELADDEAFSKNVKSGSSIATPKLGHSVHVTPEGLAADRWYFYRFHCGSHTSAVGRTRTMPLPDAKPDKLVMAVTSCQNYEQGYFTAYEQMIADAPDLVFHLGDYIYEYAEGTNGKIRKVKGPETESIEDYRQRYAIARMDPLLQKMHATCPWFLTWDDHEVDNNYANDISERTNVKAAQLLVRRANAYQVYYEMMPLRESSLPHGPNMDLYRRASFGRLAEFHILDTRQYRSDQPNKDGRDPLNDAAFNPRNTLLGDTQRQWLFNNLSKSTGTWNVLAQQVMMGMHGHAKKDSEAIYSMDAWTGYAAERESLLKFISDRKVANPIVLTGDVHRPRANELRLDDRKHDQAIVASEFIATSLSSGGDGSEKLKGIEALMAYNPGIKYNNSQRGYLRCTLTPEKYQTDFMVIDKVTSLGGKTTKHATYSVLAGNPAVVEG